MNYIKEIDGLRGLAISAVIFYHAGFQWLPGGYIGVDIFFVISGFLITRLILEQIGRGSFSVVGFYSRRIVRLIPALFVVLLFSLLLSRLLVPAQYMAPLADSSRHATLFLSNFYFLFSVDYFSPSADFQLLGHTWSLAVEEQFYLLFPWLILISLRVTRISLLWALGALAVLSFGLQLYLMYFQESVTLQRAAFYMLPARAWEILLGAMLAIVLNQDVGKPGLPIKQLKPALPLIGFVSVVAPLLLAQDSQVYYQMVAVFGCLILIGSSDQRCFINRLLGSRAMVFIGLISYSLYLWHQPVFGLYRFVSLNDAPNGVTALLLVAVSVALSLLTFYVIEKPIREQFRNNKRGGIAILFIFVVTVWALTGLIERQTKGHERLLAGELVESKAVYFDHVDDRKFMVSWLNQIDKHVDVVVMGSSRLMDLEEGAILGSVLNTSVRGASIEDLIAISTLAVSVSDAKRVFLGVDPWMLNQNAQQNRWKSIAGQFEASMKAISSNSELESVSSLNDIALDDQSQAWASSSAATLDIEARNKRSNTGRLIPSRASQQSRSKFSRYQAKGAYEYAFREFEWSSNNMRRLVALSNYLERNGVAVSWVLTPYHASVSTFSETREVDLIRLMERRIRMEASSQKITVLGGLNSRSVGCNDKEFFDVIHPHSSCLVKALSAK